MSCGAVAEGWERIVGRGMMGSAKVSGASLGAETDVIVIWSLCISGLERFVRGTRRGVVV